MSFIPSQFLGDLSRQVDHGHSFVLNKRASRNRTTAAASGRSTKQQQVMQQLQQPPPLRQQPIGRYSVAANTQGMGWGTTLGLNDRPTGMGESSPVPVPPKKKGGADQIASTNVVTTTTGGKQERDKEREYFGPPLLDQVDVSVINATKDVLETPQPGDQTIGTKPTTRKEVALLKQTMLSLLNQLGADLDNPYPSEMHAFLHLIQEEQKIYDTVFSEIIRQVTVNMIERGEVLAEIRRRYANMFIKIPRHVRSLHTELMAQRKLNRRLSEELVRARETVAELARELDVIRVHDQEASKQAQDAQNKLVSILTQPDDTDEIMEEYHKLYRMQRDRLEEAVRLIESEKRIWIDAATGLAMRIGQDHGMSDLVRLQKYEQARLRSGNHMIVIIGNVNDAELHGIERRVEDWRDKMVKLSQSVVEEDHTNIETLSKARRVMKMVLRNLDANEPPPPEEVSLLDGGSAESFSNHHSIHTQHRLLRAFHLYDVKNLTTQLKTWVEQVTSVAIRFTSDRDLNYQEQISTIRRSTEGWIEAGMKLLKRNAKNTNGGDYMPYVEMLRGIGTDVEEWLQRLEVRISGEDGVASNVISLQNQLEDKYTTASARDADKPLPPSERQQLKESMAHWIDQIGVAIDILSNTTEKEQHKVPMHVENWLARVLDQLNTDTDIRNEENLKLHTSIISWMVQLLVKGSKEQPTEAWDHEFHQLNQELISFNMNMMRDSGDIEMLSDEKKDLRAVLQGHSDRWLLVAKRLLETEKANARRAIRSILVDEDGGSLDDLSAAPNGPPAKTEGGAQAQAQAQAAAGGYPSVANVHQTLYTASIGG
ncbi:Axonemal dynein light chain domain-containing protein 1, partial [Quaeritorhiza haematococci]